ncbi:hypothetical protein [Fructobacillus fructosus]|uniref:hypothetical protein n=1 Tax=Fructobacillus fructosus TaxID=1631 RepID=UPI0030C7E1F8
MELTDKINQAYLLSEDTQQFLYQNFHHLFATKPFCYCHLQLDSSDEEPFNSTLHYLLKEGKFTCKDTQAYRKLVTINDLGSLRYLEDFLKVDLSEKEWPIFWDTYLLECLDWVQELVSNIIAGVPAFQFLTEGEELEEYKASLLKSFIMFATVYEQVKKSSYSFQNMALQEYIDYRPRKQTSLQDYRNMG